MNRRRRCSGVSEPNRHLRERGEPEFDAGSVQARGTEPREAWGQRSAVHSCPRSGREIHIFRVTERSAMWNGSSEQQQPLRISRQGGTVTRTPESQPPDFIQSSPVSKFVILELRGCRSRPCLGHAGPVSQALGRSAGAGTLRQTPGRSPGGDPSLDIRVEKTLTCGSHYQTLFPCRREKVPGLRGVSAPGGPCEAALASDTGILASTRSQRTGKQFYLNCWDAELFWGCKP